MAESASSALMDSALDKQPRIVLKSKWDINLIQNKDKILLEHFNLKVSVLEQRNCASVIE